MVISTAEKVGTITPVVLPSKEFLSSRIIIDAITIDPEDCFERDDAITIEETERSFRLLVQVPDLACVLDPKDERVQTALGRGFTNYHSSELPESHEPMLTDGLSAEFTLDAGTIRPTITFVTEIPFDGTAAVFSITTNTACRNIQAFSYEETDEMLNGRDHHLAPLLFRLDGVTQYLASARNQTGQFSPDELAETLRAGDKDNNHQYKARRIIQEFMVYTNSCAAQFMMQYNIPAVYRVHYTAFPDNLDPKFSGFINDLLGKARKGRKYPKRLKASHFEGRALYSPIPLTHDGVGVLPYAQVTSPLRRAPDLINLYNLKAYLEGKPNPFSRTYIRWFINHINALQLELSEEFERN